MNIQTDTSSAMENNNTDVTNGWSNGGDFGRD